MEVSYVEDLKCGTTSPGFAPQPVPSRIELKSINLAAADDDEKEPNKCEHFTIRGYVAEARKRDTKIGWPFALLQKHIPDQHACSLPPLSVTRFRWWNCHNCVHNSLSAETAISNGVFTGVANGEGKHQIFSYEANENVASHPSGFQKLSDGKSSEERSTEAGRSSTISSSGFNLPLPYGKKGNESVIADLGKGVCVMSNGGCDSSQEKQNLFGKISLAHTEDEIRQPAEAGQKEKVCSAGGSETAYQGKDVPDMIVDMKTMVNELTFSISGREMPGVIPISYNNNIAAPAQKHVHALAGLADLKEPYDTTAIKCVMPTDAFSPSHVSDDCNASNADTRLVHNSVETENDASQSASNANLHYKKARKVRLLNDILKGEGSCVADKVSDCNVDEKTNENENSKGKRPDAPKRKGMHLHCNRYYATKKTRVQPTMDHYGNKLHQNEDDGPSLMHWLQKVCKKSLTLKGGKGINHGQNEVGLTKISGDTSPMVHHVESCGMRREKKVIVERKQAESMTSGQILQQVNMNGKNKMVTEDLPSKKCSSKTVPTTEGAGISDNNGHHCHEILSDTLKKVILKKKKSKAPPGKDDLSRKLRLKGSFGEQKSKTTNSLKMKKKIMKKQKNMVEGNNESADDFPMDIVELLARNQHERRLLNAEVAAEKLHNLSEMAEKMTDYKFLDDFKDHGLKVSHQLDMNLPPQKSLSNNKEDDAQPPARIELNVDCRMSDCPSLSDVKRGLFFTSEVPTALSHNGGHPIIEGQLPVGSVSNCLPNKFCCNRVALQTSQSFQPAIAVTDRHSFRNTHYMPSIPISSSNLGLIPGKSNVYFIQESLFPFPEGSLRTAADRTNSQAAMNPTDAWPHMQKRKALESSIHRKTVSMSLFGNTGDCHSRLMMPVNTNANDASAAMHMLTLTDFAAYSRESPCAAAPVDLNPYGFHHESEFHYADISKYKHPWTNVNPDQDLQQGNSCKPIRPVPRIGVLGSLLHKEISTHSTTSCRALPSFKDGHSDQLSSFKTNARSKMKDSQATSPAKMVNCQISTCRDENSKRMVTSSNSRPHSGGSQGRDGAASLTGIKSKDGSAQPLKSAYSTTICVVNRNPADFAMPDEDSEYMVGNEQLKPRDKLPSDSLRYAAHVDGQKRRKVKKLTALKGIMRS